MIDTDTPPVETPVVAAAPASDAALLTHADDEFLTVIEAKSGWQVIDFRELWHFRELLYSLICRDVQVRYKQTVLGAAWAILQPLAQMLVFSVFFGRMAEMRSGDLPYPLFAFAGLIPWTFFANAVIASSNSVISNQNLITKVYFPRLFIPGSAIGVGLVDFCLAFLVLVVMMPIFGVYPHSSFIWMPVTVFGIGAAALGVGTLISALTVEYRDFKHVVPFLVQIWMFATPTVFMDSSTMGERWQLVLPFNPTYGLISNFRAAALGGVINYYSLGVSLAVTCVILLVGSLYFRRVERSFADRI